MSRAATCVPHLAARGPAGVRPRGRVGHAPRRDVSAARRSASCLVCELPSPALGLQKGLCLREEVQTAMLKTSRVQSAFKVPVFLLPSNPIAGFVLYIEGWICAHTTDVSSTRKKVESS